MSWGLKGFSYYLFSGQFKTITDIRVIVALGDKCTIHTRQFPNHDTAGCARPTVIPYHPLGFAIRHKILANTSVGRYVRETLVRIRAYIAQGKISIRRFGAPERTVKITTRLTVIPYLHKTNGWFDEGIIRIVVYNRNNHGGIGWLSPVRHGIVAKDKYSCGGRRAPDGNISAGTATRIVVKPFKLTGCSYMNSRLAF